MAAFWHGLFICFLPLLQVCLTYSYYPDTRNSYSAMSDIDWSKRSSNPYGWISPTYNYHSMADADWGWKKRSMADANWGWKKRDYNYPMYGYYGGGRRGGGGYGGYGGYGGHGYGLPLATPAAASTSDSYSQGTRSKLMDSNYGYHSMADADWGWKKRKRTSAVVVHEDGDKMMAEEQQQQVQKRNIAALARSNELPGSLLTMEKRHIGSLVARNAPRFIYDRSERSPKWEVEEERADDHQETSDADESNDENEEELLENPLFWYLLSRLNQQGQQQRGEPLIQQLRTQINSGGTLDDRENKRSGGIASLARNRMLRNN